MYTMIAYNDFTKVQINVGTILNVQDFPNAKNPSYKLEIDFGEKIGMKKSSAQITHNYKKEELIGRQILAVTNFPPKQIANFMSECLVLGIVQKDNKVVLIQPEQKVENGLRLL